MGKELGLIQALHGSTKRDYLARMVPEKIHCCEVAKRFGQEFWDGDRKYGYGGYRYDGRWRSLALGLIDYYRLEDGSRILDVGCGKGFLLHEFKSLLPNSEVAGFDVSEYAIENSKPEVRDALFVHNAKDLYPFEDDHFDIVVSVTTLHNLYVYDLATAFREIERVGRQKYIVVESYRNELEKFNLQCWALTAECFFTPDEWWWLSRQYGYSGDFEFIFFE